MTSTQEKSMASMQPGPVPRAQGSARRMSVESVLNEVEVEAGAVPRGSQDLSRLSVSSRQCQEELIEAAQEEIRARCAARKEAREKPQRQEAIDFAQRVLSEQDGFKKFTEYMNRMFDQYNLVRPTATVQVKDLTVTTQALVGSAGVPTVGNVLPQAFKDAFLGGGQTAELNIIKNVNAVLNPGKLVLLLGPPGSGKSTLLKAMTGRLKASSNLQVSGSVLYNGKALDTFTVERTAAYVDQHDLHIPVLTVGETLDFSWACSGGVSDFLTRKELQIQRCKSLAASRAALDELGKTGTIAEEDRPVQYDDHTMDVTGFVHDPKEQGWNQEEFNTSITRLHGTKFKVEMVLRLLGLSHARDTIIGNAMMRGVSGGERKRVTTGEMMVGTHRVMAMDEISTGLDSATLYTIITYLKQATAGFKTTMVISLLQPPPEVMHLFDDVMLLSEGTLVYSGPVKGVQAHFEAQGFVLPPRMDLPSWLGEITTPTGQWKYASKELKQRWYSVPDNADLYAMCRQRTKELSSPKVGSKAQHSPRGLLGKACGAAHCASSAAGSKAAELVALPAGKSGASAAGGSEVVIKAGTGPGSDISTSSGTSSKAEVVSGEDLQPCVDPLTGKPPFLRSVDQLAADFWQGTDMGRDILEQVNTPFEATSSGAQHPRALVKDRYALNIFKALGLALNRQWLLYRRTTALLIFRFIQMTVMGIIIGTLFFDTQANVDGVRVILGASFVTALFLAFGSAPELGLVLMNRGVWYKHRDNLFMQTSAELLSMVLVRAFNTAIEVIYFGCIVYFMVGYVREAGHFFTYLLLMFSVSLSMSALFRLVGAIAATPTHAQAYAATTILVLIITSGFAIIRTAIPPWWIWAYYISPIAYALRGIAVNELTSYRWSAPVRPGSSTTIGEAGLESLAFFTERKWIWIGVGYCIGFSVVVNLLAFFALKYYSGAKPRASVPDEEALLKARLKAEAAKQKQEERLKDRTAAQGRAPSKTAAAAAPEAVAVEVVGASESNRMPFTPITLVFKDLRYYVPNPSFKGKRAAKKAASKAQGDVEAPAAAAAAPKGIESEPELELLKGITGYAQPTVLMALMGGSGAGKTTLMDVIAGRKTVGRITGNILVNGQPKDQKQWARVCGYVEQNDIHTPATTVKEALQFSARLRLPPSVTDDQVATHVYDVMAMVDLTDQQYDLVGVPGASGLSTEQRKRLTIAVELVANPAVVFLDEPTSGLDARAAAIVMKAIKNVASGGRTVFVTIHQPSINIFESFDSLLLMQRGGRTTYFGPLGEHSSALVSYLESVPGTTPLPSGHNPATWMLEVTGGSMATLVGANKDVDWPSVYQSSALAAANAEKVEELSHQPDAGALVAGSSSKAVACANCRGQGMYAQGFWTQLRLLLVKTTKAYWRSPAYNFIRLMITTFCAIVYGSMYYQRGALPSPATVGDVQNILGVLYSACSFLGNVNAMTGMPYFSADRVVFYREQAALMYDPYALGIATMLCEVPYVLAQVSIFVPIVYWMVGFEPTASKFFFYFLVVFVNLMMYTSFGLFLVMSTPMFEIAQLLNTALNFIFNVFNGFTIAYNQIPTGWRWMNRIVPVTWVIYALSASQMGSVTEPMTGYGVKEGTPVYQYVQDVFGYEYDFRWYALLIAACYVVFFTFMSIMYMRHVNFLRR